MSATENHNGQAAAASGTDEGSRTDFSVFMDGFVLDVKGYLNAQKHYLTLHATEKASTLMSKVLEQAVVFGMLAIALVFLNLALAFFLGDLLASRSLGFVIVAGIYVLFMAAFLLWWRNGARDRFVLDRINELNDDN